MENTEKKSKTMTTREFLEAFIRGDYGYTVDDMTMVDKAHALLNAMDARNAAKRKRKTAPSRQRALRKMLRSVKRSRKFLPRIAAP